MAGAERLVEGAAESFPDLPLLRLIAIGDVLAVVDAVDETLTGVGGGNLEVICKQRDGLAGSDVAALRATLPASEAAAAIATEASASVVSSASSEAIAAVPSRLSTIIALSAATAALATAIAIIPAIHS